VQNVTHFGAETCLSLSRHLRRGAAPYRKAPGQSGVCSPMPPEQAGRHRRVVAARGGALHFLPHRAAETSILCCIRHSSGRAAAGPGAQTAAASAARPLLRRNAWCDAWGISGIWVTSWATASPLPRGRYRTSSRQWKSLAYVGIFRRRFAHRCLALGRSCCVNGLVEAQAQQKASLAHRVGEHIFNRPAAAQAPLPEITAASLLLFADGGKQKQRASSSWRWASLLNIGPRDDLYPENAMGGIGAMGAPAEQNIAFPLPAIAFGLTLPSRYSLTVRRRHLSQETTLLQHLEGKHASLASSCQPQVGRLLCENLQWHLMSYHGKERYKQNYLWRAEALHAGRRP